LTSSGRISAALPSKAIDLATPAGVSGDARQGIVEIIGLLIDIARAQAEIDAALLAFDIERTGTGETRRQRLCAAHAAQACSEYPFPFQ
jgi:hypothetical protein